MNTSKTFLLVAGLMAAGFAIDAAAERAEAQYYSYYVATPVCVSPPRIVVTPTPVYVAPVTTYYYPGYSYSCSYPCYRSAYCTYGYHPSRSKHYRYRSYCGARVGSGSVRFSFGFCH